MGGETSEPFKSHLPGVLVRCVKEPGQSLVLGWVELPQVKSPSLTRDDPAEEHDLAYGDKFNLLGKQVFDAGLEFGQLSRITP